MHESLNLIPTRHDNKDFRGIFIFKPVIVLIHDLVVLRDDILVRCVVAHLQVVDQFKHNVFVLVSDAQWGQPDKSRRIFIICSDSFTPLHKVLDQEASEIENEG